MTRILRLTLGNFCFALTLSLGTGLVVAQTDTDQDGVPDVADSCVTEDASFFDADGDGCIDATASVRHREYWALEDLPLAYTIHADGAATLTDGSDFSAIQAGFQAWSSVPNAGLTSTYLGTTTQSDASGVDGIHLVTFQDPEFLSVYGSAVLAVGITTSFTTPTTFLGRDVRPGQIVDADMIFNPNRVFSTDTGGSGPDLQSVATHEAGHLFGLTHCAVVTSTMFPALPPGTTGRTLTTEDEVAAYMAYPLPGTLESATTLQGTVYEGATNAPIAAAAVFAISAASGDTLGSQFTDADGSYQFVGLPPGDYWVATSPLEGAQSNGVIPGLVSEYLDSVATSTLWNPEYWDLAESNADDGNVFDAVTLSPGVPVTGIDILTNVDTSAPQVVEVVPDGSAAIRADAVIVAAFDEAIDFDAAKSNVVLEKLEGTSTSAIGFTLIQVSDEKVFIVDPAGQLDYSTSYRLTLQGGITDRFGNALGVDDVTEFTVQPAPPLTITTVSPQFLAAGAMIVLYGEGFDTSSASANLVDFSGTQVAAQTVGPNSLSVSVPNGLASGTVEVSVSTGTQVSNTLSLSTAVSIDILRGSDVDTISLSGDVVEVGLLPDATFAYVATSAGVEVVASAANLSDFGSTTTINVAGGTDAIAVAPDGGRVYAISRQGRELIVIDSNYGDLANRNMSFNTVLAQLDVLGEPVGITVDGSGQRVYVAMADGQIQVWDVELGSATFHRQVGLIDTPAASLQGALAVDRTGIRLLALTGSGELLVYQVNDLQLPPTQRTLGGDPRDLVIDPQGSLAYIVDGSGTVSVYLLASDTISQTITTGGSPQAMTINPSGSLAYLADRQNDELPGIDLALGSATFRTVIGALATGSAPTDVDLSPDGLYALSLEDGADELRIIGVGSGVEITDLQPRFGRPGDIIMISGKGFAPTPEPGEGIISWSNVVFGETAVGPLDATVDQLYVRVPDDYAGEPIRVTYTGAAVVGYPTTFYSNPLTFQVLDPPPNDPSEDASRSVFLGSSNGYAWDDVGVHQTVAASPTGEFVLAVSLSNVIYMLDADPNSVDFGQIIAHNNLSGAMKTRRLVVAPDGKLAYWSGTDDQIHILDTDTRSPGLLTEVGIVENTLANTSVGPSPEALAITGSGHLMVVEDGLNDQLYFVELRPDSPQYRQTIVETQPLGYPTDLVIHPSGLWAYFAASTGLIHIVDLDPNTPEYLTQVGTYSPSVFPRSLEVTPDGRRLLVLGQSSGPATDVTLEILDTSNPGSPLPHKGPQAVVTGVSVGEMDMWLNATGDRAIVDVPSVGLEVYLDVRDAELASTFVELTQLNINGTSSVMDVAFAPDGSGFWAASRGDTGISFSDLSTSLKLSPVSGFSQFGVAGQPLSVPIVLSADDGSGNPAVGAVAEVRVTSGGGVLGNGKDYQWITSDGNGLFSIDWTMGPVPDADPSAPQNAISLSMNDHFSVADNIRVLSVADPNTQPMTQAQVLPLDGASGVSVTTTVQATFTRAVDVNSVDATSLVLRDQSTGMDVATAYGFADSGARVSLIPLVPLQSATTYELVSTASLVDLDGGALANPQTVTFTTQSPPQLAITSISPPAATVGTPIVISGSGFSPVASENLVGFAGGVSVPAVSTGPGYVTVYVPLGSVTGDLSVTVGAESATPITFTVLVPQTAPLDEIVSTVDTGISVSSVAVLPDGSKAYTVSTETNQVLPVELVNYQSLPPIAVGTSPTAIAIHPNGQTAYVTNYGSGSVSVIDTSTDAVVTTINVGTNPIELVASPVGDRLYVVNELDQTLSVIDIDVTSATYHTVVSSVPTTKSTKGAAIAPDGSQIYLGTSDGFLIIDLDPNAYGVVSSVPTTKSTKGVAITPDGSLLLLLTTSNEILVIDVSEGGGFAVVASVPTTKSTKGAAITPDGSLLYLLLEDSDEILVVELNVSSAVTATAVLGPITVTTEIVKSIPVDPEPNVIAFDPSGTGLTIVGHRTSAGRLTFLNASDSPFGAVEAQVEMHPRTLNLQSRGRYVTAYLTLPAGLFVDNVDVGGVRLLGQLAPVADKTSLVDENQDGIHELQLMFDRRDVQSLLPVGDRVPVEITGTVDPGSRYFSARDTIRTLRPTVTHPVAGSRYWPGQVVDVTWESPAGINVSSVDVYFSLDDGDSWEPIVVDVADHGSASWTVPHQLTDRALIEVTLKDGKGDPIGIGLNSGYISVLEMAVPVAMQSVELTVAGGKGVISWSVPDVGGVDGFDVLRSTSAKGTFTKVNDELVSVAGGEANPRFVFADPGITANQDYYYLIVESTLGVETHEHGPYHLRWNLGNELRQNVPNTFNPRTTISFSIAQGGPTKLVVYNLAGRVVDVLVDGVLEAKTYDVTWEGRDRQGRRVASGVYLYRLVAPGFTAAKRMTLVR